MFPVRVSYEVQGHLEPRPVPHDHGCVSQVYVEVMNRAQCITEYEVYQCILETLSHFKMRTTKPRPLEGLLTRPKRGRYGKCAAIKWGNPVVWCLCCAVEAGSGTLFPHSFSKEAMSS